MYWLWCSVIIKIWFLYLWLGVKPVDLTAVAINEMKNEVKQYIVLADERMLKAIHAKLEADLEDQLPDATGND